MLCSCSSDKVDRSYLYGKPWYKYAEKVHAPFGYDFPAIPHECMYYFKKDIAKTGIQFNKDGTMEIFYDGKLMHGEKNTYELIDDSIISFEYTNGNKLKAILKMDETGGIWLNHYPRKNSNVDFLFLRKDNPVWKDVEVEQLNYDNSCKLHPKKPMVIDLFGD